MPLDMEVGLGPGDFVLDVDHAPLPPKNGISPHVYCCQRAGWINMVLDMEVGLSPVEFVLDGDPAPPVNFRPMFIIVIVISLEHCTGVRRYWFVQVQVQV